MIHPRFCSSRSMSSPSGYPPLLSAKDTRSDRREPTKTRAHRRRRPSGSAYCWTVVAPRSVQSSSEYRKGYTIAEAAISNTGCESASNLDPWPNRYNALQLNSFQEKRGVTVGRRSNAPEISNSNSASMIWCSTGVGSKSDADSHGSRRSGR